MSKGSSPVMKVVIPVMCLLTAAASLLPCVSVDISGKGESAIKEVTENKVTEKTDYYKGVFDPLSEGNLNILKIASIKHSIEDGRDVMNSDDMADDKDSADDTSKNDETSEKSDEAEKSKSEDGKSEASESDKENKNSEESKSDSNNNGDGKTENDDDTQEPKADEEDKDSEESKDEKDDKKSEKSDSEASESDDGDKNAASKSENSKEYYDQMYDAAADAVNSNYELVWIILISAMVSLLAVLIMSGIKSNKLMGMCAFGFSVLSLILIALFMILLNTGIINVLNEFTIDGESSVFTAKLHLLMFLMPFGAVITAACAFVNMLWSFKASKKMIRSGIGDMSIRPPVSLPDNGEPVTNIPKELPLIRCIRGSCEGLEVKIPLGETVVIGRDSSVSNVIVDSGKISRKHCAISYDAVQKKYSVIDYSSNGTFTESGEKLVKNFPNLLPSGSVIYLYNKDNVFQLGSS